MHSNPICQECGEYPGVAFFYESGSPKICCHRCSGIVDARLMIGRGRADLQLVSCGKTTLIVNATNTLGFLPISETIEDGATCGEFVGPDHFIWRFKEKGYGYSRLVQCERTSLSVFSH